MSIRLKHCQEFSESEICEILQYARHSFSHPTRKTTVLAANYLDSGLSTHSLEYLLRKKLLAGAHLLFRGDDFLYFSAYYFNGAFCVGSVRTFSNPFLVYRRPYHSAYIMPAQIQIAENRNCRGYVVTFNESNLALYKQNLRSPLRPSGEGVWQRSQETLRGFRPIENPVLYNFCPQYLMYKSFAQDLTDHEVVDFFSGNQNGAISSTFG